jgi:hypothetical protein
MTSVSLLSVDDHYEEPLLASCENLPVVSLIQQIQWQSKQWLEASNVIYLFSLVQFSLFISLNIIHMIVDSSIARNIRKER